MYYKLRHQLKCLRNEIDHISEKSIEYNSAPITVHGQFQSIVKKIDEIREGKTVYESWNGVPNYWAKPRKD